ALQIIIIEQEIKKLSDEKVKENILFELNKNLLQLIELTTSSVKTVVVSEFHQWKYLIPTLTIF
ncbi:MAG: hypothetical protein Q8877_03625, partial [Sweet potato little leaf phytoplasma]|nr:hypothetical protein [Sweet potato little leaf phytoplasma]